MEQIDMKAATDLLFSKVTYYKKREGLGSPRWHFNTYPSVLLTEFLSEKKSNLISKNIKKDLNKTDLYLQNMKKQQTTLG